MGLEIDAMQYFEKQKQSFAEAFPNITFHKEKWGFYFAWENFDHYLTNFAMIIAESENQTGEISDWQKKRSRKENCNL